MSIGHSAYCRKIAEDESFEKNLNRYDVIFLNMQEFLSFKKAPEELIGYIQEEIMIDLQEAYGEYLRENEQNLVRAFKTIYSKTKQGFLVERA